MNFKYVWGAFYTQLQPPKAESLHLQGGNCKYYPFKHSGKIITADISLWGNADSNTEMLYWPNANDIDNFLERECENGSWKIVLLSNKASAATIDPNNSVELLEIPSYAEKKLISKFSKLGFDVIDKAGISSLTNIGYMANDIASLRQQLISINYFGLIKQAEDSIKFSEFASQVATEHSPFFPVSVWSQNS